MQYTFSKKNIDYDGSQLRSHWIRDRFELADDAIAAFVGGCDVSNEYMVDLEDLNAGATIYSEKMLHFIIEHFDTSLREMVFRQRLFICLIKETFEKLVPGINLIRIGDDLYDGENKITISVATSSPVSSLIHTGINISSKNTPVKTKGLDDYNLNTKVLAELVLKKYKEELATVIKCMNKVKRVN